MDQVPFLVRAKPNIFLSKFMNVTIFETWLIIYDNSAFSCWQKSLIFDHHKRLFAKQKWLASSRSFASGFFENYKEKLYFSGDR